MKRNERGITLIALIITVIILLILAGTAISISVNGENLFGKANQAKEEWNEKVVAEEISVNTIMDLLEEASTGVKIVRGNPEEWVVSGSTLVEYIGNDTNLVIPNQIGDTKITEIGNYLGQGGDYNNSTKSNMLSIQSLEISEGITTIGYGAFYNCSNITSLTLPRSITTIKSGAFHDCTRLTGKLVIPNNITTLESGVFAGTTFNGLEIDMTNISSAFNSCSSITGSLTIGSNVQTIEDNAFTGCSGFNGNLNIPSNVTSIGSGAFNACSGFNGKLTIPNSVVSIGGVAFTGTAFNTIEIDTTEIPTGIFYGHSVRNVTIGENVRTIKTGAFENCSNLTSVSIPSTVTTIEANAFSGVAHIYYNGPAVDDGSHWGATAIN